MKRSSDKVVVEHKDLIEMNFNPLSKQSSKESSDLIDFSENLLQFETP